MTIRLKTLLFICCLAGSLLAAEKKPKKEDPVKKAVAEFFENYSADNYRPLKKMAVDNCFVDKSAKRIRIVANEFFCAQHFTPEIVENIYSEVKKSLPTGYSGYKIVICNKNGRTIEDHIANYYRPKNPDKTRLWKTDESHTKPWITHLSRPYPITKGLENRHLMVSPSHGRVFRDGKWQWQRPYLFCTTEDLYTQSVVLPYLIPMLENAGAIVCTSRERDPQPEEVIVDNDANQQGTYREITSSGKWKSTSDTTGFKLMAAKFVDGENPFKSGTTRYIETTRKTHPTASAHWIPNFSRKGEYAVYVSYKTCQGSIDDAHYTVYHKGGKTEFKVNQQMGGGTWVYLGTFLFDKGESDECRVELTNESQSGGIVSADAVRFGGGMGRAYRGDSGTSALPRYLEAARYYAQWSGMPESVYSTANNRTEYHDDIRTRGNMANYLAGGSFYRPKEKGLNVPLELFIAPHTDAGWRADNSIYGTLAISTSKNDSDAYCFTSGLSRYASADLADVVMTSVVNDLNNFIDIPWTRRERLDRNYGETRLPDIPSAIIEMLSHQNFTDLRYGHDPYFKFILARSIYKGILRYVYTSHGKKHYTVQPLPVQHFSAELDVENKSVILSWKETEDRHEPTAAPESYILYTKINDGGFDNGRPVSDTKTSVSIESGVQYSFKVTAINSGGESFPSEVLSVYQAPNSATHALIVNGFTRLSAPAIVCNGDSIGFDIHKDMGVPYLSTSAISGAQLVFDPTTTLHEGVGSVGFSGNELQGQKIVGNTFDYPVVHGKAMIEAGNISFSSCSKEAVNTGKVKLNDYDVVDYICGLECDARQNLLPAKAIDAKMQKHIAAYLRNGGNLLISGSHIGKDLSKSSSDRQFANEVLKYTYEGTSNTDTTKYVLGLNTVIPITRTHSPHRYWLQSPDILMPSTSAAFPLFLYGEGTSAGIAYPGPDYRIIAMGFPFECIADDTSRSLAMRAFLTFLLPSSAN